MTNRLILNSISPFPLDPFYMNPCAALYTVGGDGCTNRAVSEVFLGFLAMGFGLLLHGASSPPLSCSWGQTTPQPSPNVASIAWR